MAFAINRLSNRCKDFVLAMQEPITESGPELQWNGLSLTEAYVLICMAGKSKRPSAMVGPFSNFEQPILVYASSLLDLVAQRRIQFRRTNGRTCIHVVNTQPCSNFIDAPVFEHLKTRETLMNGSPIALKDCLFYCTFAENDIDPHVYSVMKSLEDKGYIASRRRSNLLHQYTTYEIRNSQPQEELLEMLRAELHKAAAPEELTLFTRILLGLVYLEYQSLKRGGMQYIGMAQNPFVRYSIIRAPEFMVHKPLLKAVVYSAREKYARLHDANVNDDESNIPEWPMQHEKNQQEGTLASKANRRNSWARSWWRQDSQADSNCKGSDSGELESAPSEGEYLLGRQEADGAD